MQKIHEQPHSNCVTALFADRELSFVLPKGATLEDLAGRLTSLRAGTPVAINVRFELLSIRRRAHKPDLAAILSTPC